MRAVAGSQVVLVCRCRPDCIDVLGGGFVQVDPVQGVRFGNFDSGSGLVDKIFDDFAAAERSASQRGNKDGCRAG